MNPDMALSSRRHHGLRWHDRLLATCCSSPPLHLQKVQSVLLLFLAHLSTTHLHIVVAPAEGRPCCCRKASGCLPLAHTTWLQVGLSIWPFSHKHVTYSEISTHSPKRITYSGISTHSPRLSLVSCLLARSLPSVRQSHFCFPVICT